MKEEKMFLLIGLILILILALSYLLTAGLVFLICLGFGFAFTWKLALGVWALITLLSGLFSINIKLKEE